MIKVNIIKKDDQINKITINGHAEYAKYGKDIVCAAVSSIVITTINAIIRIDEEVLEYKESDNLEITILKHTEATDILITNMLELLSELEKQYKKNIIINK